MRRNYLALWLALLGVGSLSALTRMAHAQWEDAQLVVTVVSEETQQPISGAEVVLDGPRGGGITNAEGVYRATGLVAGSRAITVRHLGFAPQRILVQLASARATHLSVALSTRAIPLAEIRVRGRRGAGVRMLESNGFFRRQRGNGGGIFLTRTDIERSRTFTMADLLTRVPGVWVSRGFGSSRARMSRNGGRSGCPIQYFVDGVPVYAFDLGEIRPQDVEGVEIYRGASEIPPAFNSRSAMCGAIVLWTRVD